VGALAIWMLTSDVDLGLHDEGFLWYGVLRTLEGEVPLRDFQSYDPGRYYWSAAWSSVFGSGVLGLRRSLAVVMAIGLSCGLLVARRSAKSPWALAAFAFVLTVWAFPRYKAFDAALASVCVLVAVRLLERPVAARFAWSGAFVGLAGFFGRNHGLYALLAQGAVVGLVFWKTRLDPRALAAWAGAGLLGASPLLAMMLLPGFASAYLDSLLQFTSLPAAVPWPWRVAANPPPAEHLPAALVVSSVYLLLPLVAIGGAWLAVRTTPAQLRERAPLIGAVVVAIAYTHHALARADTAHLAVGVAPLWLALLAFPAAFAQPARSRVAAAVWILVLCFAVAVPAAGVHPRLRRLADDLALHDVAGEMLRLPARKAAELRAAEALIAGKLQPGDALLVVPYRPAYYPILGRVSPVWSSFLLRPEEGESDAEMITRLEARGVDWVLLVAERAPEGVAPFGELRPELVAHIEREFAVDSVIDMSPRHVLLRRRAD
jgi:hypothetical protein